jgi:predicted dehydrogenase
MFDMGPYYITAMVNMLGPVKKVTGITHNGIPERTVGSGVKKGQKIKVEVETYIAGVLEFHSGAIGTLITSFETWGANLPRIEVYGTEASLSVPDPNGFGGPVKIKRPEYKDWVEVNLSHGYNDNFRGIGAADMAVGIKTGRKHRTSGALAFHVLDVMEAFHDASRTGKHVEIQSTCERPAMLPTGLKEGTLDE